jgi:hypothetical protein
MPGIRRIESFVDGTAIYRLEDRQERVEGSIKMNKFLVHIGKRTIQIKSTIDG